MSNQLRALSPRGRSTLIHVLGRALWRGFCLEDMTCLKRQRLCAASRLDLCTLSLFFRKVTCFAVCCGLLQPGCLEDTITKALPVSLCVLMRPLRMCTLRDNQGSFCTMKPLDPWMQATFLISICVCECGCEMSQCLLRRMTSLFLSLSKMRFDFLDVTVGTVYGHSFHWPCSPCLLFYLFFLTPLGSHEYEIRSGLCCSQLTQRHSHPQVTPGLFPYSPHVFPE